MEKDTKEASNIFIMRKIARNRESDTLILRYSSQNTAYGNQK
jgi:hypothetical protein